MVSDTIAAISTPPGEGGIAIIRVSGDEAIHVVDKVFVGKKKLSDVPTHTIHYGRIVDPDTNRKLEEVLVTVMRAPRSFTKEDVVEINCHGGIVSVRNVLELVLRHGARLAEPGEFTKRAFLNGRIDLAQAEAVIDLIRAKSDRAFSVALRQAEGELSRKIRAIRQELVQVMAHIEVNIDYPEHDVEEITYGFIADQSDKVIKEIDRLLRTAREGKILRDGIMTAIVGKPNVGKSSLLNLLARENRAIVTDIPGTTRDVVEEYVTLNGIPLRLLDTAGIRETEDVVERLGVERSRAALENADLILFVFNANEPLTEEDRDLMRLVQGKNAIVILNKADLPQRIRRDEVERFFAGRPVISMSVKEKQGLSGLEEAISSLFFSGKMERDDLTYVSNVRHIDLLHKAKKAMADVVEGVQEQRPIDMIQIDLMLAWELLGEIVGEAAGETLLDQIFSQFCLGK